MIKRTLSNVLFGSALIAVLGACGAPENNAMADQENNHEHAKEIVQTQEVEGAWENVDARSFREHMSDGGAVVVDVRTDGEVAQGMIPNAVQIEFNSAEFNSKFEELDKSSPILLYCAAGGRSGKSMQLLKDMGFNKVYNLEGGIGAWQAAEMPIEIPE